MWVKTSINICRNCCVFLYISYKLDELKILVENTEDISACGGYKDTPQPKDTQPPINVWGYWWLLVPVQEFSLNMSRVISESVQLQLAPKLISISLSLHLKLLLLITALLWGQSHCDWEKRATYGCPYLFCLFYRMHFSKLSLRTFIHLTPANWTARSPIIYWLSIITSQFRVWSPYSSYCNYTIKEQWYGTYINISPTKHDAFICKKLSRVKKMSFSVQILKEHTVQYIEF